MNAQLPSFLGFTLSEIVCRFDRKIIIDMEVCILRLLGASFILLIVGMTADSHCGAVSNIFGENDNMAKGTIVFSCIVSLSSGLLWAIGLEMTIHAAFPLMTREIVLILKKNINGYT